MSRISLRLGDSVTHNWRDQLKGIYLCPYMREAHFILVPKHKTDKFHFDCGQQLPSHIQIWGRQAILKCGKSVRLNKRYLDPYVLHIIAQYRGAKNRPKPNQYSFTYRHHLEYRNKLSTEFRDYIERNGYTTKAEREARKIFSPFVKGMQSKYDYFSAW